MINLSTCYNRIMNGIIIGLGKCIIVHFSKYYNKLINIIIILLGKVIISTLG